MADRIPSDHAAVESHRVRVTTVGRTRRRQVELPVPLEVGERIYCSLEGSPAHAVVRAGLDGGATLQDAFLTREAARTRAGEDRLAAWLDEGGLTGGEALVLDVLREGYAYGLRRPGERVVYAPPEPPNASLADIAERVEE